VNTVLLVYMFAKKENKKIDDLGVSLLRIKYAYLSNDINYKSGTAVSKIKFKILHHNKLSSSFNISVADIMKNCTITW